MRFLTTSFLVLATALTTTFAIPSSPVGSDSLRYDARGAELSRQIQERDPSLEPALEALHARMADRVNKRGESPIVDTVQLGAGSHLSGGQNYTGYKNPIPAGFSKNPHYAAFSAFDFHSLNLGVHQELIELDLFNYIIAKFSVEEFADAGLTEDDISLLRFFAQQEIGHAVVLSNLLGAKAPKKCKYSYPFNTVREALLFCEELTRWGESGVYGFLPSLDNRANAQILLQSIATEARQQYTFRQWLGVNSVNIWFETGTPQAWAWTLLSPYITECPSHNVPVGFSIYPKLTVQNQPDLVAVGEAAGGPAIYSNTTALSAAGRQVFFEWDAPGKSQGPYGEKTEIVADDKTPRYVAWLQQYNVTYSDLENVTKTSNGKYKGYTYQPSGLIFPQNSSTQGVINGTMFTAITNSNSYYTPLNLTLINGATIAGPAIYQAG